MTVCSAHLQLLVVRRKAGAAALQFHHVVVAHLEKEFGAGRANPNLEHKVVEPNSRLKPAFLEPSAGSAQRACKLR